MPKIEKAAIKIGEESFRAWARSGPPSVPYLATNCAATFDSGCEIHFNRQVRQEHIVGSELIVGILKRHGIFLILYNTPQKYVFREKC